MGRYLKQRNNDKVTVKAIVGKENDKINTRINSFEEGRAEDGSITFLPLFSDDFYLDT
ncbi:hypothetical protein IOC57_10170 [Bacillus sp. SD075]|uniref:hypothetical protein n=1 Tax=Bacillus sp. SD075 TaxID=2781732 RepID=UPI001A97991F|nr:hypothetical protein [Bacillus sp. SD075]MBO0998112.1 hypothetical protein [Bacillus sp. SD075]